MESIDDIADKLYEWAKKGRGNTDWEEPEWELYRGILVAVGSYRAYKTQVLHEDELTCPYCGGDVAIENDPWTDGTPAYKVVHYPNEYEDVCPMVTEYWFTAEEAISRSNMRDGQKNYNNGELMPCMFCGDKLKLNKFESDNELFKDTPPYYVVHEDCMKAVEDRCQMEMQCYNTPEEALEAFKRRV